MKQSFFKSVKHAIEGIINTIKQERNMRIHIVMMILVIIFGLIFKISIYHWIVCFLLFALILSSELVNTALEAIVDLYIQDIHPLAKKAKDAAAGAVLISAIFAAIIGLIIFIPYLLSYIEFFF